MSRWKDEVWQLRRERLGREYVLKGRYLEEPRTRGGEARIRKSQPLWRDLLTISIWQFSLRPAEGNIILQSREDQGWGDEHCPWTFSQPSTAALSSSWSYVLSARACMVISLCCVTFPGRYEQMSFHPRWHDNRPKKLFHLNTALRISVWEVTYRRMVTWTAASLLKASLHHGYQFMKTVIGVSWAACRKLH